jgi:hypothetical protein
LLLVQPGHTRASVHDTQRVKEGKAAGRCARGPALRASPTCVRRRFSAPIRPSRGQSTGPGGTGCLGIYSDENEEAFKRMALTHGAWPRRANGPSTPIGLGRRPLSLVVISRSRPRLGLKTAL